MKVYRCQHCKTRFVVMETQTHEYLPVEIGDNETIDDDEIFNWRKHKSHLLKCIPRRMDWNIKRKQFKEMENIEIAQALSEKSLLR